MRVGPTRGVFHAATNPHRLRPVGTAVRDFEDSRTRNLSYSSLKSSRDVDALPDSRSRHATGADQAELPAIADVDAILVRSATEGRRRGHRRREEAKVVARAPVSAWTAWTSPPPQGRRDGVQRPTSNIVTAAELACGLIVATARNIRRPAPRSRTASGTPAVHRRQPRRPSVSRRPPAATAPSSRSALSAFGMRSRLRPPTCGRAGRRWRQGAVAGRGCSSLRSITVHLPKTQPSA